MKSEQTTLSLRSICSFPSLYGFDTYGTTFKCQNAKLMEMMKKKGDDY